MTPRPDRDPHTYPEVPMPRTVNGATYCPDCDDAHDNGCPATPRRSRLDRVLDRVVEWLVIKPLGRAAGGGEGSSGGLRFGGGGSNGG